MVSFRRKKTTPQPQVTGQEVYDRICAVEIAVEDLHDLLTERAVQRESEKHILRYLGVAAILTPPLWQLETYALGCSWLISGDAVRETVQTVTLLSVSIGLGLVLLDFAWPPIRRWFRSNSRPARRPVRRTPQRPNRPA